MKKIHYRAILINLGETKKIVLKNRELKMAKKDYQDDNNRG